MTALRVVNPDTFNPDSVRWVSTTAEVRQLCDAIARADCVVIDLETTGLDAYRAGERVVMASLTLPGSGGESEPPMEPPTYVVGLSHPDGPLQGVWRQVFTEIAQTINKHSKPLINQNLGFDLRWIHAHTGIDLTHLYDWDTQISSHLLDEVSSTRLKERAPAEFGIARWDDHDLSTPAAAERVPFYDLGIYAARDTYWTWRLAELHRYRMGLTEDADPYDVDSRMNHNLGTLATWLAMPMGATLARVSQDGIQLDRAWLAQRRAEATETVETELAKLTARYHVEGREPSFAPTSLYFQEWAQLAVAAGELEIMAVTVTGKPQWNKGILAKQARNGSEVAASLLAYRSAAKQLEFLTQWENCADPRDVIHATYHAGRVVSGRLSSSDPNMQQVNKGLKPAFVPREGYVIAELDYSQIELRVAAFISQCEPMLEAYRNGDDLHTLTASKVTGKPLHLVTKDDRQAAKAVNFGFLYGMGAHGFQEYADASYGVIFTEEEATEIRGQFFKAYPELVRWHARQAERARRDGYVVSPIGRVRRLPDIHSSNDFLVGRAERNAINSPVQGFASDLMQLAAASIAGLLPDSEPLPVRIIATVHDSIVLEVPADDWKKQTALAMRRMKNVVDLLPPLGCHFTVPLEVEASIGTRWGLVDIAVIK